MSALGDVDDDLLGGAGDDGGVVDLQVGDAAGAAGGVRQVAVEQLGPLEVGRIGDAVDGTQDRVDLELVCSHLRAGQPAGVGGLPDQALELGQQVADFAQAAVGGPDDVAGEPGIADGSLKAGRFGLEALGSDEARRIVGTRVDPQTGAQTLEARVGRGVVRRQGVLRDQRADIGINNTHGTGLSLTVAGSRSRGDLDC
jgi:hypothetical protein